jgi:hypothetical protein
VEDEQLTRRQRSLTPTEIIIAMILFGVVVVAGVLMIGRLPIG